VDLRGWGEGNGLAAVLLFEGPRSFTGEDVAEVHLPNSPAMVRWAIDAMLAAGREGEGGAVRLAGPGEFSARAFFNGKMDLTEAEGIAATISAASETQLRAAASLREGDLHKWTVETAEKLANLLALVEAGIDFVDEEGVRFIDPAELRAGLQGLAEEMWAQLAQAVRIDRLDDLPTAVFVGKPNVGKSSLINALAGRERSIVSPVAGTTRDMLSVTMETAHGHVRLVDVPGEEMPSDELRAKMMAARGQALLDADLVVEVVAADQAAPGGGRERPTYAAPVMEVMNKADLLAEGCAPGREWGEWQVSARTGQGIETLREDIGEAVVRQEAASGGRLVLNQRHRALVRETRAVLVEAGELVVTFERHPELLAAELRRGLDVLGQITGTISPDEVLGRIFSTFCIGK
jgi:tRNA modification GTPase